MLFTVKELIPVGARVSKLYLSSGPMPGCWTGGGAVIFTYVFSKTTYVVLVAPLWDTVSPAEKTMASVGGKALAAKRVFFQHLNTQQQFHVSLTGLETYSGKQTAFHLPPKSFCLKMSPKYKK